jgi:hypothetical protein
MYWSMLDQSTGWFLLLILFVLISIGGWLIASFAFQLRSRERLMGGMGIGLVSYVFFSNVLGQILGPSLAFWFAGFLVFVVGLLCWFYSRDRSLDLHDFKVWPLLFMMVLLAVWITLIGRGIAIFDDRKNLSIISTMAAGDIPPHFYMNPDYRFNYHYGFQLIGAGLMRVGGLYPWSAFDLSKGIVSALAIMLAAVWGWRATHSKLWATATAFLVTFASGGRWLLNFLPQSILRRASGQIELWGASGSTVTSLFEGLGQTWAIDGGPPLALPFAYVNGILQPFVLKLHKGPISLNLVILFLALLLIGRHRGWKGTFLLGVLFATWALVAEAEFILFGFGLGLAAIFIAARGNVRAMLRSPGLSNPLLAFLTGGIVSVFQGGTITEMVKGFVGIRPAGGLGGGTGLGGFQLRWPPAIVSAHLGELRITSFYPLLVALFEMGPAILAGVLVVLCVRRWIRHGRIPEAALAFSSFIGILAPLFLKYDIDRDITRMTAFALMGWIILAVPVLAIMLRRYPLDWLRVAIGSWVTALILGGLVVTGSLNSAIPRAVFSYHIADLDVHMTRLVWDQLPDEALVISAHQWAVVPVTGRLTRTSVDNTTVLDTWLDDINTSGASDLARGGFDFVYMDEAWWGTMSPENKASFSQECVLLFAEVEDTSRTHFRRLYDVGKCVR